MARNQPATEGRRIEDIIDSLIEARKNFLGLLIEQIDGGDVVVALDAAIVEVKRSTYKLGRLHPDAELLSLKRWSEIGELGILVERGRDKKAGMSKKELGAWRNAVVSAMNDHTAGIVTELEQQQASLRPASKMNPRDKYCYERMKKGDLLKAIMAAVNRRKGWEPLETVQGVSQAAKRHARKHGLKWPLR
jgi:hypothetical protein